LLREGNSLAIQNALAQIEVKILFIFPLKIKRLQRIAGNSSLKIPSKNNLPQTNFLPKRIK
jgi:hypothetical protein